MLQENEIKEIIRLIKQGKKNYRIWKITGIWPNTVKTIRKKMIENNLASEEDVPYTNSIDKYRGIIANFESFVKTEQLNDRERKKS